MTYKNVLKFSSIFILMFLYSCASDDIVSDNPSSNDKDFLEKYDGYGFISDDDGEKEGWYFSNSDQFLKYFFKIVMILQIVFLLKKGQIILMGKLTL